jgi:hypothetical protein
MTGTNSYRPGRVVSGEIRGGKNPGNATRLTQLVLSFKAFLFEMFWWYDQVNGSMPRSGDQQ